MHADPGALALFDLNGDGKLDLVCGGAGVDILLGDGRGGLARVEGSPFAGPKVAEDFAFGDFDGDSRTDVLVAEHDQPRFFLFRGTAAGSFEPAADSPFIVDAKPHLHTIAACDFDGDGHLDVITDSWPESRLVLVAGRGDGTFATPGRKIEVPRVPIHNLRVADMNGDGIADIVTPAHDTEAVSVRLGDGKGTFRSAPGSPYASFGGFSRVALGDLDRDGDIDVAEVHRSDLSTEYKEDGLSILSNDGTGRLAHAAGSPFRKLPEGSGIVAIGDVDGDGWPDVVTLSDRSRTVAIFHGGRDGFVPAGTSVVGGRPAGLAVGDLDGDGRAEVLFTDREAARVFVLPRGR